MKKLTIATLVFLIKESDGEIAELCLAMKKRGFGEGRWNGAGGKVDLERENVEDGARRETEEEIGISPKDLQKVATLGFTFVHNPEWNQNVTVFFCREWEGDLKESEEMKPKWFKIKDIPYENMWPDDIYWLPEVLRGKKLEAEFKFGKEDVVLEKEVRVINHKKIV